jgi:cytochrome o ubiquinol oxidase operon protein cyoD
MSHGSSAVASHGSIRTYLTGFLLSALLTAIPFFVVMKGGLSSSVMTAALVLAFGVVQIVVHMVYFLHMNTRSEGGWNLLAFLFTLILVVIAISGSMWVMHHLNHNMMPGMMHGAHDMP